jgi:hypothetical protein
VHEHPLDEVRNIAEGTLCYVALTQCEIVFIDRLKIGEVSAPMQ